MSGIKEKYSVNMAGVVSLGRKENPAGSSKSRRGGAFASDSATSRKVARARRL